MITPRKFKAEHFIPEEDGVRKINSINAEALEGSELIDNLILLKFCDKKHIQTVLKEVYNIPLAWIKVDPTPEDLKEIANKHNVLLSRDDANGSSMIVYIPLGATVDDSTLQIDIPNYRLSYVFIPDCNLRLLRTQLPDNLISESIAPFRPQLVFRRLILDCIERAGTNMRFESVYIDKVPHHRIKYRINREPVESGFSIDFPMMQRVIQEAVGKLSPASASDLDAPEGVTTDIADPFADGTCELRLTGMRVSAGYCVDIAIQLVTTTSLTLEELGFPDSDVTLLRQISQRVTGLTLITGKQRTGKNTTMFAMLNELKDAPLNMIEYSNPIENRMSFPQINYRGDVKLLAHLIRMAKKQDLDLAIMNEIPNKEVAFAVRDLVNSAIGVLTTTHLDRAWHLPYKLREFYGDDYKTVISQINVVINHRMFRKWECNSLQKRTLQKEQSDFHMFCYKAGVRQYFVPMEGARVVYRLQPLAEFIVLTDSIKTAMLNYDEIFRAEQMLESQLNQQHGTLENKVADYINRGLMSLDQMRQIY